MNFENVLLKTLREAWKERHDARKAFAKKPNSGKAYEALKRAEAWFEIVAYAKHFPVHRPVYSTETTFLEAENQKLRAEFGGELERRLNEKGQQLQGIKDELWQLSRMFNLKVQLSQFDEANKLKEQILELQTKETDLNSNLHELGPVLVNHPEKLMNENQMLSGLGKRQRLACIVCTINDAKYWRGKTKEPVCDTCCFKALHRNLTY